MIKRIHHIAIVVPAIDPALAFWQEALGLELAQQKEVPEQQVQAAFLPIQESEVEIIQPTTATSGVARYLAKRGPGIHHLCFEVDDIEATLVRLKGRGVRLIDETARVGADGCKYAFVHPEGTNGVLVELYELTEAATLE